MKLDQSQIADLNVNCDIILDEISKSQNKSMTRKLVKYNKHKHTKSWWISQGLHKSIRYRDKSIYKFKKSGDGAFLRAFVPSCVRV